MLRAFGEENTKANKEKRTNKSGKDEKIQA